MTKDKIRLTLIAVVTILVLCTTALYGYMAITKDKINSGSLITLIVPLLIIIFMAFFILRRYKSIKQGEPLEDERSKKVINQAAAKSFYISMYWLLFIGWLEEPLAKIFQVEKLDASQTIGGGIAGMAIIFLISWVYYERRGKLI